MNSLKCFIKFKLLTVLMTLLTLAVAHANSKRECSDSFVSIDSSGALAQVTAVTSVTSVLKNAPAGLTGLTWTPGNPRKYLIQSSEADTKINELYFNVLTSLDRSTELSKNFRTKLKHAELLSIDTPSLQKASSKFLSGWFHAPKSDAQVLRFVELSQLENLRDSGFNFVDIYGNKSIYDWAAMMNYLTKLPEAEFQINLELLSKVHTYGSQNHHRWLRVIGQTLLKGIAFSPGQLKSAKFNDLWPIKFSGWSDQQLSHLKGVYDQIQKYKIFKDRKGECVDCKKIEVKSVIRHADGTLSGTYTNPGGVEFKSMLSDLIEWTNRELNKVDMKQVDALDPIEIAAIFQYAFVYIHPFVDGNGRVSRAIKDRILQKYSLAPDLRLPDLNEDLTLSLEDHILHTRIGIRNMIVLSRASEKTNNETDYTSPANRFVMGFDFEVPEVLEETKNTMTEKTFSVGSSRSLIEIKLKNSGILIDQIGIPYVYHRLSNSLLPVADKSLLIYVNPPSAVKSKMGSEAMSNEQRLIVEDAIWLSRQSREFLSKVQVHSYDLIADANARGDFFFHENQLPHLVSYLKFQLDPQYAGLRFLAGKRVSKGHYESELLSYIAEGRGRVTWSNIIAHYEIRDFYLYELEQDIAKYSPRDSQNILQLIHQLRAKLHSETRMLVDPYLRVMFEAFDIQYKHEKMNPLGKYPKVLSIPLKRFLNGSTVNQLKFSQLRESKLRYSTFEEAISKIDDSTIIVGRVAEVGIERTGFIQPVRISEALEKFPLIKKFYIELYKRTILSEEKQANLKPVPFIDFVTRLLNRYDILTSPKFAIAMKAIGTQIFQTKEDYFGFEKQYHRMITDMYLQLSDKYTGKFFSTSVSMEALTEIDPKTKNLMFAGFSESRKDESVVYAFRVDKAKLERQPTQHVTEYEMSLRGMVTPLALKNSLVAKISSKKIVNESANSFDPKSREEEMILKLLNNALDFMQQ